MFLEDYNEAKKGASREEFASEMRRLRRAWRDLPAEEKEKHQLASKQEFLNQRKALRAQGIQFGYQQRKVAPEKVREPGKAL